MPTCSTAIPRPGATYGFAYVSDANGNMVSAQREHFAPVTPDQFRVVQSALDIDHRGAVPARAGFAVEGFTQLEFDYAGPNGRGTLRFANSSDAETAYAALPGGENGGDVWFGDSGRFPEVGNYDLATILHEIGHTLGLKHPHLPRPFGAAPQDVDSLEFSVMSYRSFVGARPNAGYHAEDGGFPQSFMMLDIAALQHLYGANFSVNSGNTVYNWSPDGGATSGQRRGRAAGELRPDLRDDLGRGRDRHLRPLGLPRRARARPAARTCVDLRA